MTCIQKNDVGYLQKEAFQSGKWSSMFLFPLLWYQGFQTDIVPSDDREEGNSNTERTWCGTYISLQNTEIRGGMFVTAAQTSLPWLIYSQTQISKHAEYTPYIYNPFVTLLQLTPLRNFHHRFRTRTMKRKHIEFYIFTLSLFVTKQFSTNDDSNQQQQKKKCDMGCRQPVCVLFSQPTAINNTTRKAHIALDGRHKEKHFCW